MKVAFSEECLYVTLYREKTDPKFYGNKYAAGEHRLLHYLAKWLNARGFDLIKKRAQSDGHLIGDIYQPYLRCRKPKAGIPHVYVWSGEYALRGANEDWNKGQVSLIVTPDCFERGQQTEALVKELCCRFPAEMSFGGEPHLHDLR